MVQKYVLNYNLNTYFIYIKVRTFIFNNIDFCYMLIISIMLSPV